MKAKIILAISSLLVCFVVSCSEITKEAAKVNLEGNYKGTSTTMMNTTNLNEGIKEEMTASPEPVSITIKRNEGGGIYFEIENALKLKINNVQLATNGATFNIPEQSITFGKGELGGETVIIGLNEYLNGEARCDGFYGTEKNELSFSFGGKFTLASGQEELEIPFTRRFLVSKLE